MPRQGILVRRAAIVTGAGRGIKTSGSSGTAGPVEENVHQYLAWLDTQTGTDEYLFEAQQIMAERGVVQRVEGRSTP
jgi:hypothetical protein